MEKNRFFNWNESAVSEPEVVARPKNIEELVEVIKNSEKYPSPLRAAGSFHSMNNCFASKGTQVILNHFNDINLKVEEQTVTVGAFVNMIQLRDALREFNMGIEVEPEIGNATAGSVACCGTKDASIGENGLGQVSSTVVGLRMVDSEGNIKTFTEDENPEEMRELRCSYGLFGIIFEVTFQIQENILLHYEHKILKLTPTPKFEDLLGQNADGFLGFLLPYYRRIVVERRTQILNNHQISLLSKLKRGLRDQMWENIATFSTTTLPYNWFYSITDRITAAALGLLGASGGFQAYRSDSMIDFKFNRKHYFDFTFWAIPISQWDSFIPAYLDLCEEFLKETGFRTSLPSEVYLIGQDQKSLLSFSPNEPVFTMDLVDSRPTDPLWHEFNRRYNDFVLNYRGRPLLNQTKELNANTVKKSLGQDWINFVQLQDKYDPNHRFLNQFFNSLFEYNCS